MPETGRDGLPIIAFTTGDDFAGWLAGHHADTPGLWVRMYKKRTGKPSVAWPEAVEAALCYGWIDSVRYSYDDESFIQRFTPRRKRSIWSKINRETVGRLIADGRMRPPGLAEVERAKADGRWAAAYGTSKDVRTPKTGS